MSERPATAAERERIAALARLCEQAWQLRPAARLYGHLRVRSGGRERELLLGGESWSIAANAMVIDWERAPLAEVFATHRVGDEYELTIDAERHVQGTVLARELIRVEARDAGLELREIDDGELSLRRRSPGGDEWIVGPSRLRSPLPLRDPPARRKASSPVEVELDPIQRAATELPDDRSLLVLGEAGFGKTTVALHRVAYLYRQAEASNRAFAALILVPTKGLRRLLVALLERMGIRAETPDPRARASDRRRAPASPPLRRVEVRTFARWIAGQGRRAFPGLPERDSQHTPLAVIRLKRHPALRSVLPAIIAGTEAMREVAEGYLDDERPSPRDPLLHLFGDRELLTQVVDEAAGALTRSAIAQTVAHTRVQFSPTTEHAYAHLDRERLQTVDGQAIDAGTPMADAESIDVEDFPVLFELAHLRGELPKRTRYDHVVLDEAQEFAPIELAVIGRALREHASITVAGDENQQVDETTMFTSWPAVMAELLDLPDPAPADAFAEVVLRESYRCPPRIEALARSLFDRAVAPSEPTPEITWSECTHELELVSMLIEALEHLRERDRLASVAIVCRFAASARRFHALLARAINCRLVVEGDFRFGPGVSVTCVDEIKGLEFDYVIVPDATSANYPDGGDARRALYVVLTRAMHRVWLLWIGRRSALLGG